jgi:SAM-dependent methyltransferase
MALPFPDGRFAGAYAIEAIVHMSDRAKAVAEIGRTLRPGATLVTADFFLASTLTPEALDVLTAARAPMQLPPFPEAGEYEQLMAEAGLEVVAVEDITANIHRSHRLIADTVRRLALESAVPPELREQLIEQSALTERIATLPQLHYGLTTARRL